MDFNSMGRKVYVTIATFKGLAGLNKSSDLPEIDVIKGSKSFLSDKDFYNLRQFSALLNDKETIHTNKFSRLSSSSRWTYVSDGVPKYHFDVECRFLRNHFDNVEVPEEIRIRGTDEVVKYRQFALENLNLYRENKEKFALKVSANFFLKADLKFYEYDNSGILCLSDPETIRGFLEDHIIKSLNYLEKFDVSNMKYAPYKSVLRNKSVSPEVYTFHNEYKRVVIDLYESYIASLCDNDFSFDPLILDRVGFLPCKACS